MKQKGIGIELWVGIFMLLAIAAFVFMSFKVSGLTVDSVSQSTYTIKANFTDIGSLKVRSAVRIAGVQIGTVKEVDLNPTTYQAEIIMSINKNIAIPSDSSASITASGILGDNFVSITPGYAASNLANGGEVPTTYSATSWQSLISTFMSSSNSQGGGKK